MPEEDVVIAGGGPNGLMLAAELCLAGVRPVVLEKLPELSAEPRANGLVGQVVRLLDSRGLYEEFSGQPGPPRPAPFYTFSGFRLSLAELEQNPLYLMPIPQPKLVRLLDERARKLGADIRYGNALTDFTQHDDHVTVTVSGPDGPYELTTRFLVGADGGKSQVRKRLGVAFPGATSDGVTRIAHVSVPDELRTANGGLRVPGMDVPGFGHHRLERGMFVFAEIERGRPMIATTEYGVEYVPDGVPVTLEEVRESLRRVLGADVPVGPPSGPGPHALRRINGQHTRQAARYRDGRVLLLGDAAHVHSALGGPGLNLGLQDAANLGWKLAAHVNGWAPPDLLDTYQTERHPVGERVMMHSLTQTALMAPGPQVTAMRQFLGELLQAPDNVAHIAHLLAGSDVRYDTCHEIGGGHPLSGYLVPDLPLDTGQRTTELLHQARPVLLDLTPDTRLAGAAAGWADRVDTVAATSAQAPAGALLIRPDGYVAWAGDDQEQLRKALTRWFGA